MSGPFIVTLADCLLLSQLPRYEPLRRRLEEAIVVSSEAVPADVVTMNSRVRCADATGAYTVTLVYPSRADAAGLWSVSSPHGAAILGLSAGRSIDFMLADGSRRRLRVEEVLYQPERALRAGEGGGGDVESRLAVVR